MASVTMNHAEPKKFKSIKMSAGRWARECCAHSPVSVPLAHVFVAALQPTDLKKQQQMNSGIKEKKTRIFNLR